MLVTFEKSPHILITNDCFDSMSRVSDGLRHDVDRHKDEKYYG